MPCTIGDKIVAQGDSHFICQDYALTGTTAADGEDWAIVSDGCSSAEDSDWGARLLAQAAQQKMHLLAPEHGRDPSDVALWLPTAERYHDAVIRAAADYARTLDLKPAALTATLLTTRTWGDSVLLMAYGDGVLGMRERETGRWNLKHISFADGKASYLSYRLHQETLTLFRSLKDNERRVTSLAFPATPDTPLNDGIGGDFLVWVVPRSQYDVVCLLSDGATSFTAANESGFGPRRPLELAEALPELLDYPNTSGGFLRRSYQFAKKRWKKQSWSHYDDLALAALYLTPIP